MKAQVILNGKKRNEVTKVISNTIDVKSQYQNAPTMAYKIGEYTFTREAILEFPNNVTADEANAVLNALTAAGFEYEVTEPLTEETVNTESAIEVPIESVNVEHLIKLLNAKGKLIKKALAVDTVKIEELDDKVAFPWFAHLTADTLTAYTKFIKALCKMSKDAKRVTAKDVDVVNDKYAFRCLLLRLGFIGDAYKSDRKILLKNLTGSAAFNRPVA